MQRANNRLEFARVARPTRKGEAPLLAAQPGRWASEVWRTRMIRIPRGLLICFGALGAGCASQASLTIYSQPEGAFLTEAGTGNAYGAAPITVWYEPAALRQFRDSNGCFLVKGFEARWVSGVAASLDSIRLCGSENGYFQITFNRDPSQPGLDKDMQFALQLQAVRAQQQQAQAAEDAAAAALFSAWSDSQPVVCTSKQVGNSIQTTCR